MRARELRRPVFWIKCVMMNEFDGGVLAGALSGIAGELSDINRPAILAIGDVALWRAFEHDPPLGANISLERFENVDRALIEALKPVLVLSPLMWLSFDCVDLALALQSSGYEGRFRVMSPPLPKPDLILSELAAAGPSLQVKLIATAQSNGDG